MMKAGKSARLSDTVVAEVISGGVSADMSTYREQYSVVKQNFGTAYVCLARLWHSADLIVQWFMAKVNKCGPLSE